jgi:uncharacterized membrane protein YtjA (UPF0391 family)
MANGSAATGGVTKVLFALTIVVEIAALFQAVAVRSCSLRLTGGT